MTCHKCGTEHTTVTCPSLEGRNKILIEIHKGGSIIIENEIGEFHRYEFLGFKETQEHYTILRVKRVEDLP